MIAILMTVSLFVLSFTIYERPWKEVQMNYLAIFNEAFLYSLLVLVIVSMNLSVGSKSKNIVGWLMIIFFTVYLQVNLAIIAAKSYQHLNMLCVRRKNLKAYLERKKKVSPASAISKEAKDTPDNHDHDLESQ